MSNFHEKKVNTNWGKQKKKINKRNKKNSRDRRVWGFSCIFSDFHFPT